MDSPDASFDRWLLLVFPSFFESFPSFFSPKNKNQKIAQSFIFREKSDDWELFGISPFQILSYEELPIIVGNTNLFFCVGKVFDASL